MTKYVNSMIMFVVGAIEREPVVISDALEAGLQNSEGLFQKIFKQNLAAFTALRQGNPNKQGPPMKGPGSQYVGVPPGLEEFLKIQKTRDGDTYYEPYWKDGQWVYERKVFTPRPPRYLAQYPNLDPNITKECAETCPRIYEGFGMVCAHSLDLDNGVYKVKQFLSLCHMMFENCVKGNKRTHKSEYWRNATWRPMLHGSCDVTWKKLPKDDKTIAEDTMKYLEALLPKEVKAGDFPLHPHPVAS